MNVTTLTTPMIPDVIELMELGEPYIRPRTYSDYWLYAQLFASTCPVALIDERLAGAVMAFRSQEQPDQMYVQDVMTHPDYQQRGVARALLHAVRQRADHWGCTRMFLTSEPGNNAAYQTWSALGFRNVPGDYRLGPVSVTRDYKGPGKDRAIYELALG